MLTCGCSIKSTRSNAFQTRFSPEEGNPTVRGEHGAQQASVARVTVAEATRLLAGSGNSQVWHMQKVTYDRMQAGRALSS